MSKPNYPLAPRGEAVDHLHGRVVADPYRWLEDRADPKTQRWLAAQDQLFNEYRSRWLTWSHWRHRLEDFMGSGTISGPVWRGERRFFVRRKPGQDHAVLLMSGDDGAEHVLLDPNAIDPEGTTTLDAWSPSKEGDLLAYQLSVGGSEESALYVIDVNTRELIEGPIDRTRYSPVAWLPGGNAYYYVRRLAPDVVPPGEEQYHRRVWLHHVGTDPALDVMIFGEHRKKTEYFGVGVSRDGAWLTISASEGTAPRNEIWVADLRTCDLSAPNLVTLQSEVDAQTGIYFGRDGRAYIYTDREAQRGRLCVADPEDLSYENWRELIPEDPTAVFEGYAILDDATLDRPLMLVSWTRHAISEISVHDLVTGERIGEVELPGLGTVGGLLERPEGGHEVWFTYTDHITIPRVLRYDAVSKELAVDRYPPGFVEVPNISAELVTYPSSDGTAVRMMILAPLGPDGQRATAEVPRPTVLYGYGGFAVPMVPSFSPSVLAWVEQGGVYAIACIRGGSEEGEWWHRAGMLGNKQNVFNDFIAAAEWLVAQGWTTTDQLVISGGSNGGLLVGAAMTQRPDLFAGVHCSAPLLDMIRYEKFGLGETWNVEYGTVADATQFEWLRAYSPYHKVQIGAAYPATLFTVFDRDTRVDPMHARKMCAALQHATQSEQPILIRAEADVGHGARSVSRSLGLSADVLAFMAEVAGLTVENQTRGD